MIRLHTGTSASRAAEPPYQGPDAFTREPLWSHRGVSKRDQATQIPLQSSTYDPPEFSRQRYRVVDKETASHHLGRRSVTQARGEQQQQPTAQQSSPSLNQLWERFNAELRLEEARATRHREVFLLEIRLFVPSAGHEPAEKRKKHAADVKTCEGSSCSFTV